METLQNCRNLYKTVLRLLNGYIAYLRKRKGEESITLIE